MAKSVPQNQGMSEDTKTIIVVLLLVFIFPVGLVLMWFWTKWPLWVKILISIPTLLVILSLAAITVLTVRTVSTPVELQKQARDAARLNDLANIQIAINNAKNANVNLPLCVGTTAPCQGKSNSLDPQVTKIDGSGWVKINLEKIVKTGLTVLPVDPLNTDIYYYRYCSDGKDWEIETKLESEQQKPKMINDGGIDPATYEVGSKLGLCK